MRVFLIIISLLLILIGMYVGYEFFSIIAQQYTYQGSAPIKMDSTGQVGDFVGGVVGTIFSLAGTILLILTLYLQSSSNYVSSFEEKFFKLIDLHRANIEEISINRAIKPGGIPEPLERRRVFKVIFDDIITCRDEINIFFEAASVEDIYDEKYHVSIQAHLKKINRTIDLKSLAILNISYCIVFFGVGDEGETILISLFKNKFKEKLISEIIRYIKMKPVHESEYWKKWEGLLEIKDFSERCKRIDEVISKRSPEVSMKSFEVDTLYYANNFIKYYGGNQFWLGHYYRHFFQSIKYVNNQRKLTFNEKYFYVKTFRAQLSTYEQALLLVNSLSFLGMIWELTPEYKKSNLPFVTRIRRNNNLLITRYNLIKNLPGEHISGINYKEFYPNVEYEIDRLMKF